MGLPVSALTAQAEQTAPIPNMLCGLATQVLDGAPIDAAEQAAAKAKYSGRLTTDFLEEKLGHRSFDRIRDLDVSGLKVCVWGAASWGLEAERWWVASGRSFTTGIASCGSTCGVEVL